MSPPSARIVQYGKRFSLKKKAPLESINEPSPKRQKLVDDRQPGEVWSQHTVTLETVRGTNVSVNEANVVTALNVKPHMVASSGSAANPRASEPRPLLVAEDEEELAPTLPNTPQRSLSPMVPPGSSHTPRNPKDLSEIFAPLSRLSSHLFTTPPKSLTKRMLVRSRTEPTLLSPATSSPPKSGLKASLSLSAVDATPTPLKSHVSIIQSVPPPQSPSPILSRSTVRTYSQSRSFLVPLPASLAAQQSSSSGLSIIRDTVSQPEEEEVRESYTDLRTRWGVDNSENDLSHVSDQTNDLLSITELRSKGESRRFLDEVGYLFEGLEEPGLTASVRRSSAAEIVMKMCDMEFVRIAKAADFVGHAWDSMRKAGAGNGDKVLDLYLIAFVALVARDKRDLDDLSRRKGFFDTMLRMLQYSKRTDGFCVKGDANARKAGYSKSEWIAVSNLRDTIVTKSNLLDSFSFPSTRLFASYTLSRITPTAYPEQLLSSLMVTLLEELQLLRPQIGTSMPSITADLSHIDHCLVILDACLLGSLGFEHGRNELGAVQESLCSGLTYLCGTVRTISSDSEQYDVACQCTEDALRVLINLSHISTEWCERLVADSTFLHILVCEILSVSSAVMKQEPDDVDSKAPSFDRQCLALALLSNVLFMVGDAKDQLRDILLSTSCAGRQRCALSCHCARGANAITRLINLFVKMALKSELSDTPELDFFQCHLAALLCLSTIGNSDNEVIVRREIMKANGSDSLKSSVQFFLRFYEEAKGPMGASQTLGDDDIQKQVELACAVLCR